MFMLNFLSHFLKKFDPPQILRAAYIPLKNILSKFLGPPLSNWGQTLCQAIFCFLDGSFKLGETSYTAQRMRNWRENESYKDSEKRKRKSRYNQNKASKTKKKKARKKERKEEEREKTRVSETLSQQRIKKESSCQKLQGLKLKERNQKREEHESNNPSTSSSKPTTPLSTERIKRLRENKRLLVNLNINHSSTSTRRTRYLVIKMKITLNVLSAKSKKFAFSIGQKLAFPKHENTRCIQDQYSRKSLVQDGFANF